MCILVVRTWRPCLHMRCTVTDKCMTCLSNPGMTEYDCPYAKPHFPEDPPDFPCPVCKNHNAQPRPMPEQQRSVISEPPITSRIIEWRQGIPHLETLILPSPLLQGRQPTEELENAYAGSNRPFSAIFTIGSASSPSPAPTRLEEPLHTPAADAAVTPNVGIRSPQSGGETVGQTPSWVEEYVRRTKVADKHGGDAVRSETPGTQELEERLRRELSVVTVEDQ